MTRTARWFTLALVVSLMWSTTTAVFAATIVGNGTPASCDNNTFAAALTGGGEVLFNCGGPHTIITDTYVIENDVTVDGGGLITLDGETLRQFFFVNEGASLTLRNITLTRGGVLGNGGAILNQGKLVLENVTIQESKAEGEGALGGALANLGGTAIIRASRILSNTSSYAAGAIDNSNGHVTIEDTIIAGNVAALFGAIDNGGYMTITHAIVRDNIATTSQGGGVAIVNGSLVIEDSLILRNTALSDVGGGVSAFGGVTYIANTDILSNTGHLGGGGVYLNPNPDDPTVARMNITSSRIAHNRSTFQLPPDENINAFGGGIYNGGKIVLNQVDIYDNDAGSGGGIFSYGDYSSVTILNSTFRNNDATYAAGGLWLTANVPMTLTNNTVSDNTAAVWGGGIRVDTADVVLQNFTITGNSAPTGANLYNGSVNLMLRNTVLANPVTGSNCAVDGDGAPLVSLGYNFDSDASCALNATGDQNDSDPLLGPLADNGGPTLTHLPLTGSPLIDQGDPDNCPAGDQRNGTRPQGEGCDVGAVEVSEPAQAAVCGGIFPTIADATVDPAQPTVNLGSAAQLQIGAAASLFNFDLSSLPEGAVVQSAQLEATVAVAPTALPYVLQASDLAAAWVETSVTHATQPAPDTTLPVATFNAARGLLQVDVTPLVARWVSGAALAHGLRLAAGPDTQFILPLISREGPVLGEVAPRLVIACTIAPTTPPLAPDVTSAEQEAALKELQAASTEPVELRIDGGAVAFASFNIPVPEATGDTPPEQGQWFIDEYSDLFGMDAADGLQLIRMSDDGRHLFYRQRHDGVPIVAAELALHLRDTAVVGFNGNYTADGLPPPVPVIDAPQAEALAIAASTVGNSTIGTSQLRYVDQELLSIPGGEVALTWEVHIGVSDSPAKLETIYIDAYTGAVVLTVPNVTDSYDLDLEDGNDAYPDQLCDWWEDDDDIDAGEVPPESVNAANNMGRVYDFWRGAFGRDSYDDDGEQIELNIHVQFRPINPGGLNTVNASYGGCDLFVFSRGTTTLDITGHEFSHAVDANEGGLIYLNQSGALDESYADIWGYFVDSGSFLIGDGSVFARAPNAGVTGCSATPAMRDMVNPACYGDPDHILPGTSRDGTGLRPAVASGTAANDNGSVHTNSGIHNKVASLIVVGGTHNIYSMFGLGQVSARRLFHNVFVNRLTGGSNFLNARDATIAEALEMRRAGQLDDTDVCTVRRAFAAVGLGFADLNCDGVDDAAQPDPDGDGIPRDRDNCQNLFNPFQADTDGDGIGNDCDPDIDNDGRPNATDNCKLVANPGQADFNNNGFGDACDDTDGDSALDSVDNCRTVFNPTQADMDRDGLGDACDPDIDGDLRSNALDNCPVNSNPGQEDNTESSRGLPRDGIGDACDLCPQVSSPDNSDPDRDGLANPCDDDDDGDGVLDIIDNCPSIANADQFDWDNNGKGFVCDAEEQKVFGAILKDINDRYVEFDRDFIIPVPICPDCVGDYLPNRFESVINLQLPIDYKAAIVDSQGDIVAKSVNVGTAQQLSFNPKPFSISRQLIGAADVESSQVLMLTSALEDDQERYYLTIIPEPSTDLSQAYPLSISLTEAVAPPPTQLLYIPALQK